MGQPKNNDIDLGMAVICAVTPEGFHWTHEDIADVCGCSYQYIHQLEQKAIKKLQGRTVLRAYT